MECQFDVTSDARSSRRRIVEESEYHQDLVDKLFRVFRECDPANCESVLTTIRQNAPISQIIVSIDSALQTLETPYSGPHPTALEEVGASLTQAPPELLDEDARKHERSRMGKIESILDVPYLDVPSKPWTSVIDDSKLVSQLITAYFTWCHPTLQIVDRSSFIQDMQAATLGSRLCSCFLVNALLALGCVRHDSNVS